MFSKYKFRMTKNFIKNTYYKKIENYCSPKNTLYYDIYNNLTEKLINCVKKRLYTDRECGALLSGGVDSSLVCAIASMLLYKLDKNKKLYTFTIGMNEKSPDIKYAEKVAEHLNNKYNNINRNFKKNYYNMLINRINQNQYILYNNLHN